MWPHLMKTDYRKKGHFSFHIFVKNYFLQSTRTERQQRLADKIKAEEANVYEYSPWLRIRSTIVYKK